MLNWIKNYFNTLCNLQMTVAITDQHGENVSVAEGFSRYIQSVKALPSTRNKLIFIGNGGSAAIASHLAIDFSKNGKMPAIAFTDAAALTCLSNDYGYEHAYAKQIEFHSRKGDVVTAISSSGRSANILKAVSAARIAGCKVMTFSGFEAANPLRKLGDLNFYIDSMEYGFVEVAHLGVGHAMLDYIIEEQSQCEETQYALLGAK